MICQRPPSQANLVVEDTDPVFLPGSGCGFQISRDPELPNPCPSELEAHSYSSPSWLQSAQLLLNGDLNDSKIGCIQFL